MYRNGTNSNRRISSRLGGGGYCCKFKHSSPGGLEYTHDAQFLEYERDIGCAPLFAKFRTFPSREESTNFNGQRFLCSIHKFSGRNACGPVQCSHQDLEFGDQTKFNHFRQMVGREIEHNAGLFKSFRQQIQLDNSPKSISISRQNLGTSYIGQVCMHEQRTVCQVQQSLPRPNNFRGGCLFSNRLAGGKQFHKRTLPSSPSYSKQTRSVSGLCHYHSSIVQSSPIFSETDQQINSYSYTASQSTHVLHTNVKHITRTVKKPKI